MADHGFDQRAFQALGVEECRRLLAQHHLSRIGLVDADGPLILPVNYVLHRLLVVFRTEAGTKLDAAVRGARVAFEVDAVDQAGRSGWSALVRGDATEVTDAEDLRRLRALPLYPWAGWEQGHYVRITPMAVSGRRISLPEGLPVTWWG